MFKVDTGAEVTVIPEDLMQALNIKELQPPSKSLHGLDNKLLSVRGEFQAQVAHNDNECIQPLSHIKHNVLGLPAIQALQLEKTIEAIGQPVQQQFLSRFTSLGTLRVTHNTSH